MQFLDEGGHPAVVEVVGREALGQTAEPLQQAGVQTPSGGVGDDALTRHQRRRQLGHQLRLPGGTPPHEVSDRP